VATRLSSAVRTSDTVARLGGDEFAVLLADVERIENIEHVAATLREQLFEPFSFAGRVIDCQASMGGSLFPGHGRSKVELMKSADIALYVAKRSFRGQLCVFEPSMRDEMQRRLSMLSLAKGALKDCRIVPHYQPKIDLKHGTVSGFEALLRWRDWTGRLQLPGLISAAFEDVELASAVSDEMIERVLDDVVAWSANGVAFGHVALNAGAVELRRHNFVDALLERMRARGIAPHSIQLEVTETVFLGRGSEHIHSALQRLSSAGVRIALDDFGTGFASLSHLNKHPVDLIKIDRSFIENIRNASAGEPIVDAVIGLGRSLGIEVVAEGIETEAQHTFLKRRGCSHAQGFLYSPAVPAAEVKTVVSKFKSRCFDRTSC
jgi:predicted signal transduction protein with EAL and GGDEF domain